MDSKLEIIWHSLEEETQDTVGEVSWVFLVWRDTVDDVHLEIEQLAVDGVLRRCMEVVLQTLQLAVRAVLIEQANGLGFHVVVMYRVVLQDQLIL